MQVTGISSHISPTQIILQTVLPTTTLGPATYLLNTTCAFMLPALYSDINPNQEKYHKYLKIGYIAQKNLRGPSRHPYGPSLMVHHHFTKAILIGISFISQILQ